MSPSNAPLRVQSATPLATRDDRFVVRVRISSDIADLAVFTSKTGDVDGFSASVVESGARCIGGGYELSGIRSFSKNRSLIDHVAEMTRIPAGTTITLTDEFICRGTPVRAGETVSVLLTVNYLDGNTIRAAQIQLPEQVLASPGLQVAR